MLWIHNLRERKIHNTDGRYTTNKLERLCYYERIFLSHTRASSTLNFSETLPSHFLGKIRNREAVSKQNLCQGWIHLQIDHKLMVVYMCIHACLVGWLASKTVNFPFPFVQLIHLLFCLSDHNTWTGGNSRQDGWWWWEIYKYTRVSA